MLFHLGILLHGKVIIGLLFVVVVSLVIEMIWYHPKVLGKLWEKPVRKLDGGETIKGIVRNALPILFLATIVACFVQRLELTSVRQGVELGLMLWFGFILPIGINGLLFADKSVKDILLSAVSYEFVQLAVMGALVVHFLAK